MPKPKLDLCAAVAALCCVSFVAAGAFSVASLAVQTDEALFAGGIYRPFVHDYVIRAFHRDIPLMVMTYVGTVKSFLYRPILALFPVSAYSVRIPALLIGALTIWLFYRLLCRTAGRAAALAGCVLLATDTMFLLTIRWDWGPVAIQHFCLAGALLGFVRFHQEADRRWLGAAAFLLGVGVWDKALFVWSLTGIAAAAVLVLPRELRAAARPRNVLVAFTFLVLGASPLILYNARHNGVTFRTNGGWSASGTGAKARLLKETAQGAGLFGVVARDRSDGQDRNPGTAMERAVVWINGQAGEPRRNLTWLLWLPGVLLLPFVWRTPGGRAARFALAFCVVAWAAMAFTKRGGSIHHVILIWPMPYMVIAPVLASIAARFGRPGKAVLVAAVGAAAVSNFFVTSTYYTHEIRYGGVPAWSDAFYSLSSELKTQRVTRVGLLDWGFFDNLRLFHEGRLDILAISVPANDRDRRFVSDLMSDPGTVFVTHARAGERFNRTTGAFLTFADNNGYGQTDIRILRDRNGRDAIKMFRFAPPPHAQGASANPGPPH